MPSRIKPIKGNKKEGPRSGFTFELFPIVVVTVGWQYNEPAVDWERSEFDAEAGAFFVRKGRSDLGPLLPGLAVALVLFDGEDVKTWIEFVVRAAVKPSLAAADKTFCAFAILRRLESQGFAFPGKSRSTYTSRPVLYAPENKLRSTQGAHVLEYCA